MCDISGVVDEKGWVANLKPCERYRFTDSIRISLYGVLLFGLALSAVGGIMWSSIQVSPEQPPNAKGFLVFASPYASYHSDIAITIDGVLPETMSSNVTIHAKFAAQGDANETFILALQIPYNYSDLDTLGLMSSWSNGVQIAGGEIWNGTFRQGPYDFEGKVTYIYAVANRTTGALLFDNFDFTIKFKWLSSVFPISYSAFGIIVPFALHYSGDPHTYIPNFAFPVFPSIQNTRLQIVTPEKSIATLVEPGTMQPSLLEDRVAHSWNIIEIATKADPQFPVITQLNFASNDKQGYINWVTYFSALFLGVGIPTVISSLVELRKPPFEGYRESGIKGKRLKESKRDRKRENRKRSGGAGGISPH